MDERALLFGVAAGPGCRSRKVCRVEVDLIGAGGKCGRRYGRQCPQFQAQSNFTQPCSNSLQRGAPESGGAGTGARAASPAAKVERNWSPRLFYFCYTDHSVIHMSLVLIA